ncbi:MAG TPA: helix-turn-helix transcriptional regulator [Candidatus Aphodousia faecigallinarum]|uniref:Helix-turn-helix transcriptional regulator n=1 Tax=Candidatus Aphodousia faecigallinarum TaxID=2840677 RepID=A0A9D1IHL1_9BURK|nr:helix-turn-helix transcriptional regulator [Candidatus Aphodousia faecigallinarum]
MSSDISLPHQHGHIDKAFSSLPQTTNFEQVANVFKQLSDPVRCRIFLLLCHSEECVINIAAFMNMSSPAVAHHLRLLKYSGLVQTRREGKEVFYRAADSDLAQELHYIIEKVMNLSCCNDAKP